MQAATTQKPDRLGPSSRISEVIDRADFRVVSGVAVYAMRDGCDAERPRFTVAATQKVGKAVDRNKVKRRLREILRELLAEAAPIDVVAMAVSSEAVETGFHELKRDVRGALEALGVEPAS